MSRTNTSVKVNGMSVVKMMLAAGGLGAALTLGACAKSDGGAAKASGGDAAVKADAAQPAREALKLPASAEPVAELKDLAFMAGRWVGVAPRASLVNEEHWMTPRGNAMVGTFRQVRRDGKTAFVEVSQIEAEKDGIVLRLRHMHSKLEVPEERKELSIFKLKSAGKNRAEFTGTGKAEGISAVIYTLSEDGNELSQELVFDPTKSKEKGFTTVYRREGK